MFEGVEVFVNVVECGSFSAAARHLGMPVTTVSGKVAQLEKRLGITLIHRTTRRLHLTGEGEAYLRHSVRARDEMQAAENELVTAKTDPEGLLRLTAPPDIGRLVLPPIVLRFLESYPKTRVELILTSRMIDMIGEGVDLAIRAGGLEDSTLVVKPFLETRVGLWASRTYADERGLPLTPEQLAEHEFVGLRVLPEGVKLRSGERRAEVRLHSRVTVDDLETAKTFVMAGAGIGMFPSLICRAEQAAGDLVEVLSGWLVDMRPESQRLAFVYPPQRFVPPKIRKFIELALAQDPSVR